MSQHNTTSEFSLNSWKFLPPFDVFWDIHELWQRTYSKLPQPFPSPPSPECQQYIDSVARSTRALSVLFVTGLIIFYAVTIGSISAFGMIWMWRSSRSDLKRLAEMEPEEREREKEFRRVCTGRGIEVLKRKKGERDEEMGTEKGVSSRVKRYGEV